MAYNPNLYNPYGNQQNSWLMHQQVQQQPFSGINFRDIGFIDSYTLPAGSVSEPLFINDKYFAIKSFDQNGGSNIEWFKAVGVPYSEVVGSNNINVTKADLEAFEAKIMEVLNEHLVAAVQPTTATATGESNANPPADKGPRGI